MIDLEIFSCAGGMAEGFRRAGITFDMAVDLAKDHCDSYEKNLGHRPVQMDARDLLRMLKLGWRISVRLLVADPPCAPWSRAGKRKGLADDRDMLRQTAEIIAVLRPRAYLIGNVPGLEDSGNLPVVQEVIGGLARYGYCVADFATLNASSFGVPQHRVRPFWYGHRFGPCIRWPQPTHGDPDEIGETLPGVTALRPWVTCRDALGHLSPKELGRPIGLRSRACNGKQHGSTPDRPARVVGESNLSDGNVILLRDPPPAAKVTRRKTVAINDRHAPAPTVGAKQRHQAAQVLRVDRSLYADQPSRTILQTSKDNAALAWPWDRPSTTVQTDPRIPPPGHHSEYSTRSMPQAVLISEKAAAILQGYPETWVFSGKTKKARWSAIGQGMPPPLAHAVALAVREQLEATVDDEPGERFVPWSPAPERPVYAVPEQLPLYPETSP